MTKPEQAISILDLTAIEQELQEWWRDLNLIVGPLALTMAIGCKSLSYWPGLIFSVLGVLVMCSISSGIKMKRNARFLRLRELANTDEKAKEALKYAEENFLPHRRYLSHMIGLFSLCLMAAWHVIGGIMTINPPFRWMVHFLPAISKSACL